MASLNLIPYGPFAWLLRFAENPSDESFVAGRFILRALEKEPIAGLVELVPGYTSILLEFDPKHDPPDLDSLLTRLCERMLDEFEPGPLREVPVVYDGPDLVRVAEHAGLNPRQVIELHSTPVYRVAMIGFAPGFPYLDGLDARLHTPRLPTPRPSVAPGSVAIGGAHAGIYSISSPGGWNLIGRTEVQLFDPKRARPEEEHLMCWLQPGDRVRFVPRGRHD